MATKATIVKYNKTKHNKTGMPIDTFQVMNIYKFGTVKHYCGALQTVIRPIHISSTSVS